MVSVGGTQEPIDPVRYISNHSSGKMDFAVAETLVLDLARRLRDVEQRLAAATPGMARSPDRITPRTGRTTS